MTDSAVESSVHHQPQAIFLRDYQVPPFLIDEIDLTVDLFDDETFVRSRMRVRYNRFSTAKSREFLLNGIELTLKSVKINGEQLSPAQYKQTDQHLILLQVPDQFELEIENIIYPQKNTALSGLYRSRDTYCTQCEAEGFRRITFFPDRPDVLARYTTTISADAKRYPVLLSNGNLIDSGKSDNGRHWVTWEDPFMKPCYLFALVAGDFDLLQDTFVTLSNRVVDLRIYVEKGYGDQAHHAMYSLKEAMRWDETAYGREYDLDIYMIVAIGDFNMGAMENKGLNIFNTKYVLAKPETATDDDYINILSVIGHEYFHNWSGNRITCRDWFQLSLKEGFTIFRDQTFSEDMLSKAVMRIREVNGLREMQFPEDNGPLAHNVRPDSYIEINNFYTSTIYNKGSEVLRMMQTIVGNAMFRKGTDLYFARHDGQAVTIEDFVKAIEDVSGINLRQFRRWYSQAGTPVLTVQDEYDAQSKTYRLTMSQSTPPTPGQPNKLPLHIPVRIGLISQTGHPVPLNEAGDVDTVLHLIEPTQTFEFKNIHARPVPSLLRNFSAPVKLKYAYSDQDLPFLFKHDSDAFNRWEAGQQYALRVFMQLINDHQNQKPLVLPEAMTEMFDFVLKHEKQDYFLLAEMLTLPSEKYIGEQMTVVDVNAIHAVREFAISEIAQRLQDQMLEIYLKFHDPRATGFDVFSIGKRQLKNRCLMYLMQLPKYAELGLTQFESAITSNMTDVQPALASIANSESAQRERALKMFYDTWKKDALVVDKWLAIQALSKLPGTLNAVRELMKHEAFDIKNPNKVYALIGSFGARNPFAFHVETGEGYEFLREVVQQLDKLNPQVAGRMVNPLTQWRRYDKERQVLMRQQLEVLLQDKKLSKDLYELVTKSLEK